MRLLSTILAVFLAVSMAILPISMLRAADLDGAHHGGPGGVAHSHDTSPDHFHYASAACTSEALQLLADRASQDQAEHDPTAGSCCSLGCHAFQVSDAPGLFERASTSRAVNSTADEQVVGVISSRIDRPPRTV